MRKRATSGTITLDSTELDVARFYDRESHQYDRDRLREPRGTSNARAQSAIIESFNKQWENKRILEIGTGTGRIAMELAVKGSNVVGVDFSAGMLGVARRKLRASHGTGLNLVRANGRSLPFADSSFDGCVCVNVLGHVPDFRGVLSEISRVLKDGAFAIVSFPNLLSLYLPFGIFVNLRKRSIRKNVFSRWLFPRELDIAAGACGLGLKSVAGHVHIPGGIPAPLVWKMLSRLDRLLRFSPLRRISPTLFLRLERKKVQS